MTCRRLVAIVGPTATGKSAIALQLARELGGEIVNADSRQVYRRMDIGTAKPPPRDRDAIPHHLYDIAEPGDAYSLALYMRDARTALESIWAKGSFAWLVGGTGQYLWGLLEAWTVPEVAPDAELRAELAQFAEEHGAEQLHARLAAIDPAAAERIGPGNIRRISRALEVFEHTGKPISEWQRKGPPGFEFLVFGIDVPNDDLEPRIASRVDEMFESGFVDEVRILLEEGLSPSDSAMSSIGYREVVRYLTGDSTLAEARDETIRTTRKLVRRQRQWFRAADSRIRWVRDANEIAAAAREFVSPCGSSEAN